MTTSGLSHQTTHQTTQQTSQQTSQQTTAATSRASLRSPAARTKRTRVALRVGLGIATASVAVPLALTAGRFATLPAARAVDLGKADLYVTSFVQNDRIDVRRNERLQFRFSAYLKNSSIDERSLRVLEVTATGQKNAVGARFAKKNNVFFEPTRTQRNYAESLKKNSQVTDKDNTEGFTAYTDYVIEIPGTSETDHVLRNAAGAPIRNSYVGGFRSNDIYFDPVEGQPFFTGFAGSGQLGFDPPKSGATGLVDEDAIVILEFSEPIKIETLDPSSSVLVKRISVNEAVPGFIRIDPVDRSGRRFQFVPSLGFGSDEPNKRGWDISVEISTAVTDLAGNPLKRPVVGQTFLTRYVPNKPSGSFITETFANQTFMDPATVTAGADWNTTEKGALRGGSASTYPAVNVIYTTASTGGTPIVRTRVNEPLVASASSAGCFARPQGARVQALYVPADVGIAAAVVSAGWGPSSNALFGATHSNVVVRMGHTSLNAVAADFPTNVNVGGLVTVYSGSYTIPQAKNIKPTDPVGATGVTSDPNATGMWLWPTFSTPFEWNGVNNLVLDMAVPPSQICQILRIGFVPAGFAFPTRRAVGGNANSDTADLFVEPVVYDAQFNKRRRTTVGTSNFYQVASDKPIFAAPIVTPSAQAGGVTVAVEMEGADGKPDPLNPGGFIPNTTTATGWTTNLNIINNHRFVRFRVIMTSNLATGQTARVANIQFPYQF